MLWRKNAAAKSFGAKAPRAKIQRSVSHEVERAIPLISASAPYATTLAHQPCRNLAHMRAIWLNNPVDFLFSSRQLPSFSIEANVVFPSQLLAFSIWAPGAIRLFLIKRVRPYRRKHRARIHGGIEYGVTTTSRTSPQQHRV